MFRFTTSLFYMGKIYNLSRTVGFLAQEKDLIFKVVMK